MDSRFRSRLHEFSGKAASERQLQEVLLKSDAAREIVRLAQEQRMDLIVMSTHGYGPFRRFLLGSVTAKILHDVNCPMLTGTHTEGLPPDVTHPYKRVGCAIDLGDHSEALLRWANDFARSWGAALVVIHATPLVQVIVDDVHIVTADWRDMVASAAEEKVRNLIRRIGCDADFCVDNGHPVHFVTSAAFERNWISS